MECESAISESDMSESDMSESGDEGQQDQFQFDNAPKINLLTPSPVKFEGSAEDASPQTPRN